MRSSARVALATVALLGIGALAWPEVALAHGLVQRADLPIPEWLFGWAAAIVLVVSFVALALLWQEPRLEGNSWRPLPGGVGRALASAPVESFCAIVGVGLLAAVVWSGFAGKQIASDNFAPTFVFVIFWVGLVPASALLGDVFRLFNPWRAIGRAVGTVAHAIGRRPAVRAYPARLGRWPAALGLVGFAWIELASQSTDKPRELAIATLVYSGITFGAMAVYGVRPWIERGEAFSVYYNLFSRISPWETRDHQVGVRPFLSGLPRLERLPGTIALLAVMIGTVTFDGFSQGSAWANIGPDITNAFKDLGTDLKTATELAGTVGIVAGVTLIFTFYRAGVAGARSVGGARDPRRLGESFVHSLVPIALAYVMAHYVTFLLFQGQAMKYLISDPLGNGSDYFGTAKEAINYGVIGQYTTWYLQVGVVVAGHVAGLTLAHDRALVLYENGRSAIRSQYWMLGVMVGFTSLALWLLARANA